MVGDSTRVGDALDKGGIPRVARRGGGWALGSCSLAALVAAPPYPQSSPHHTPSSMDLTGATMCDSCATPAPCDSTQQARDLHRRIRQLVTIQRRSIRDLALGLARVHAGRLYRQLGYAGLVEYGEQAFGFSPTKSRQLALLGRKLPELQALDRAMVDGALGWTKARTLVQIATPDTVQAWVERALQVNNRELEELVARTMPCDAPPDPAGWHPRRECRARTGGPRRARGCSRNVVRHPGILWSPGAAGGGRFRGENGTRVS